MDTQRLIPEPLEQDRQRFDPTFTRPTQQVTFETYLQGLRCEQKEESCTLPNLTRELLHLVFEALLSARYAVTAYRPLHKGIHSAPMQKPEDRR